MKIERLPRVMFKILVFLYCANAETAALWHITEMNPNSHGPACQERCGHMRLIYIDFRLAAHPQPYLRMR